jgi:hypothetical protein
MKKIYRLFTVLHKGSTLSTTHIIKVSIYSSSFVFQGYILLHYCGRPAPNYSGRAARPTYHYCNKRGITFDGQAVFETYFGHYALFEQTLRGTSVMQG